MSSGPNAKIEEERKAGENAKAVLDRLTSKTARTDRIIFVLRYAADRRLDPRPWEQESPRCDPRGSDKVAQRGVQFIGQRDSHSGRDQPGQAGG
jgi:hypothetical protein